MEKEIRKLDEIGRNVNRIRRVMKRVKSEHEEVKINVCIDGEHESLDSFLRRQYRDMKIMFYETLKKKDYKIDKYDYKIIMNIAHAEAALGY